MSLIRTLLVAEATQRVYQLATLDNLALAHRGIAVNTPYSSSPLDAL
ncbi:hypothetical protein [Vibrio vulnificus YJ016]|uniref:Uncharacterized protein n=1 Tax=Vibrio vulnificus (strain YJ016) TaxID=196600 RepID=Q7MLQ6_VIBVY|nr:hypothetical protein [Vibrio vulnificus YJ016]